jgi:DNA-binding response OmpR family regulator
VVREVRVNGDVLVVDDDPVITDVVRRYLERDGFAVRTAADGRAGLTAALAAPPCLLVLDLMLPELDGLEVFRRLRAEQPVPVIMLTARGDEEDRVAGLELGADDYLTKPFSPRELALRVAAVLRRTSPAPAGGVLRDGDLVVDLGAREARRAGRPLPLTAREFDLLAFLMQHPRQAFDRSALLTEVWEWSFGDASTVTVHVRRLREKVEDDPSHPRRIVTVFGVGYRYEPQEEAS